MKRLFVDSLCLSLLAMALGCVLDAAPAPKKKEQPAKGPDRAFFVGEWTMYWGTTRCPLTLSQDGTQRHLYGVAEYTGTWKVSNGVLTIRESDTPDNPLSYKTWSVKLLINMEGLSEGYYKGVKVRLQRAVKQFD